MRSMRTMFMPVLLVMVAGFGVAATSALRTAQAPGVQSDDQNENDDHQNERDAVVRNARQTIQQGRRTFRFDTFGDEAFWGGALGLHLAIEGKNLGGTGDGVSPRTALAVGLKVDADALPEEVIEAIRNGTADLDDPKTTLQLMQENAVVGVTGFFNDAGTLRSVGIQCAFCHSTVDDSVTAGIGSRLDGWANRDLNVGAIVSLAPNLEPFATLLGVDEDTVRHVLTSWGPGKFDAELILDGKAFRPDGKSAATLIPPAFGQAGVNLHTWTGWGSVTHWNAFVANLEMHGIGTFFDPRLDDPDKFPIAAANGFGHIKVDSDSDRITKKLGPLHFYQLAIRAPRPPRGSFDPDAAERGDDLFGGKAKCGNCHIEPLWTEPGWNLHTPEELGLDDFQANRAPDRGYRTTPLAGIWTHTNESRVAAGLNPVQQGGFFHDGRFGTLLDVINHYNEVFSLGLTDQEKHDLVEYVKSL